MDNDLKVSVLNSGIKVLQKSLRWLNFSNKCISLWSQFENLATHMRSDASAFISDECLVSKANKFIDLISTEDNKDVRTLLKEQLHLSIQLPQRRRFSSSAMISSFALFSKSTSFYESVRQLIILSSYRWLRKLSTAVTTNCNLESKEYLQKKAS